MTIKYRTIKQAYYICDWCEKEIRDGNFIVIDNKHYHSVWNKKNQGNTCFKQLEEKQKQEYRTTIR